MKAYIILGNNRDTQGLIDHMRGKDNGTITIVDEELENGLHRRGGLIYVGRDYVECIQNMNLPFVYYHHIQPEHRKDRRKWRRSLSSINPNKYEL